MMGRGAEWRLEITADQPGRPSGRRSGTIIRAGSSSPCVLNLEVSAQYVADARFDGTSVNASGNNAIYLLAWWAMPLGGGW
jgi:hypothetical protein